MEYSDWLKYNEEPEHSCPICGKEVNKLGRIAVALALKRICDKTKNDMELITLSIKSSTKKASC